MSDVTLLRTLTRKSTLRYGSLYSWTVQDILCRDPLGLAKDYFKYDAITFTDDILDELCIPAEMRISKPGKLPHPEWIEAFRKVCKIYNARLKEKIGEEAYMHQINSRNAHVKRTYKKAEAVRIQRKGAATWFNQGH